MIPTSALSRILLIVATASAALLLAGCATPLVVIEATPPGAMVAVRGSKGQDVTSGIAPVTTRVEFPSRDSHYTIITLPPVSSTNYSTNVYELTKDVFDALPTTQTNKNAKRLDIKLETRIFEKMPDLRTTIGTDGLEGFLSPTGVRSYFEISEPGGVLPQRIKDVGENDGHIFSLTLSPDGTTIVYSLGIYEVKKSPLGIVDTNRPAEVSLRGVNLNSVSTTSGGVTHITRDNFMDLHPAFTKAEGEKGAYLLFATNRRRPRSYDILRIPAATRGGVANIYLDERGLRAINPSQAEDGTIAFALYPNDWKTPNDVEIWTLGGPNKFPTQIAKGIMPQISPDGKRIAYIGPDSNLWKVNVDGSAATQLTSGAADILKRYKQSLAPDELVWFQNLEQRGDLLKFYSPYSYPCWSGDGKLIAYASMQGNDPTGRPNEDIWTIDDAGNNQQLTTNGSADRYPVISPDGKWIYFLSNRGRNWAIWRIATP